MKTRHHVLLGFTTAAIAATAVGVLAGTSSQSKISNETKVRATHEVVCSSTTTTLIPMDVWPDVETMLDAALVWWPKDVERSPGKRVVKGEGWGCASVITITAEERELGTETLGTPYKAFEVRIEAMRSYAPDVSTQMDFDNEPGPRPDWRGAQTAADYDIDLPTEILYRLRRFGVSSKTIATDKKSSPVVIDVAVASALRPYSGQRVTLRGRAEDRKVDVSIYGRDVKVLIKPSPFFSNGPEQHVELTGRLEFVHESRWRTSVSDDPNIGPVQDYGSGPDPIIFILHVDK